MGEDKRSEGTLIDVLSGNKAIKTEVSISTASIVGTLFVLIIIAIIIKMILKKV